MRALPFACCGELLPHHDIFWAQAVFMKGANRCGSLLAIAAVFFLRRLPGAIPYIGRETRDVNLMFEFIHRMGDG